MTTSAKDKGRFVLHRKIEESWQWGKPLHRAAWMWILLKAAYKAHNGLKPGQCYFTLSQAKSAWGMTKDQARGFIRRCVKEGDILWEPGRCGVKASGITTSDTTSTDTSITTSNTTCRGKITLLNHKKYNSSKLDNNTSDNTSSDTSAEPSKPAIEKESIKNQSKERTVTSGEVTVSPHNQVFNFYVQTRRELIDRPTWNPTDAQGAIIGANIKQLLKKETPQTLISWLTNYFNDTGMAPKKWPWTLFMSDPVRWSDPSSKDLPPGCPGPGYLYDNEFGGWVKE